jgi:hypothetical protein
VLSAVRRPKVRANRAAPSLLVLVAPAAAAVPAWRAGRVDLAIALREE